MSNELSELIALGCPDLTSSTNSVDGTNEIILINAERRLSVKQMTATELANMRAAATAAAAAEAELQRQEVEKVRKLKEYEEIEHKKEAEKQRAVEESKEAETKLIKQRVSSESSSVSRTPSAERTARKLLPTNSAPRERIISLPNLLDDAMEIHLMNAGETKTVMGKLQPKKAVSKEPQSRKSSSTESNADYETAKSASIADSVELLRIQRRARDERSNNHDRVRSISPSARCIKHERSAAPDRLHNSSSISSLESAVSGSASASVSISRNASKNVSRRGSTASMNNNNDSEVLTAVPPPKFPLSKTISVPNMERRRSSLTALFHGPSPLVVPEYQLHTNPIKLPVEPPKPQMEHNHYREIPSGKMVHRTKTPPPVGANLGVCLKRVSPPKSLVTVKKNDAPMLGVVLRKVEKKTVPQKSILDDDQPLYHLSIVRDGKEHKISSADKPKPKPTPSGLQKSATTAAVSKTNVGGILTGPQVIRTVRPPVMQPTKPQRPQPGVPITIQKIEGDKIIIIKKIIVPKNSKIPEQYLQVGASLTPFLISVLCRQMSVSDFPVSINPKNIRLFNQPKRPAVNFM